MAMTPQQQAEYNALMGKKQRHEASIASLQNSATEQEKAGNKAGAQMTRQQIAALQSQGPGYAEFETQRIAALERGDQSNKSALAAAMQGVPELPKLDFSQLLRRRQVGSPEYAAQRAQMAIPENRAAQMAQRQLAAQQAKSGVRGGAAAAQGQRLAEQSALQRAGAEQALFAKNIGEREKIEKQQQFGGLSSELARMQMASAELGQQRGLQAASDTAAAQRAAAAGAGGCCMVVAASTALLGLGEAEASELVLSSKTPGAVLEFKHPRASQFVRELNGTRKIRDEWCNVIERRGYYCVAEALSPYVVKSPMVAKAVYTTFVQPVVACAEGRAGFFTRTLVKSWIKVFNFFGSEKPFTRKNGEVV